MPVGVGCCGLIMTASRDGPALFFVRKVIRSFGKQVFLAFIIIKIFSWNKVAQKICLKIAQEKAAASHDIKGPLGDAAFDAAQGNVQVYFTLFEDQRHLCHIIYRAVIDQVRQGIASVMGEQVKRVALGKRLQKAGAFQAGSFSVIFSFVSTPSVLGSMGRARYKSSIMGDNES